MIEAIGSITTLQAKPDEYAVAESDRVVQENARAIEERPVENTGNSSESTLDSNDNENSEGKFLFNGNKISFVKYDKSGEVILQIPPLQSSSV